MYKTNLTLSLLPQKYKNNNIYKNKISHSPPYRSTFFQIEKITTSNSRKKKLQTITKLYFKLQSSQEDIFGTHEVNLFYLFVVQVTKNEKKNLRITTKKKKIIKKKQHTRHMFYSYSFLK